MPDFEIRLPAIRGIQAGRPFFIAICPTRLIPRLMPLEAAGDLEDSPLHRVPDRGRSQEIARYVASNPEAYVIPSITCLVEGHVHFDESTIGTKARPSKRAAIMWRNNRYWSPRPIKSRHILRGVTPGWRRWSWITRPRRRK